MFTQIVLSSLYLSSLNMVNHEINSCSEKGENKFYDFKKDLNSIEWIKQIPEGIISDSVVDLCHNTISIYIDRGGINIYIAPVDQDNGGDALLITLNEKYELIDYVIERLEPPVPFNDF